MSKQWSLLLQLLQRKLDCLRGLSEVLHATGIKRSDHTMQEKAKGFQDLYDHEWSKKITCHVLRQMKKTKWKKGKCIPLTEDTVKLNQTLATGMKEAKVKLQQEVNVDNWRRLCEVTLAQAIVFNRRRPGDTQYLEVQDFESQMKEGITQHDEIFASLSPTEKIAASCLNPGMLRGKRDRGVPILLKKEMPEFVHMLNWSPRQSWYQWRKSICLRLPRQLVEPPKRSWLYKNICFELRGKTSRSVDCNKAEKAYCNLFSSS